MGIVLTDMGSPDSNKRMIRFKSNPDKALEVILWICQRRNPVDFHTALKVLFWADKYHLNEYGRPVIGDVYKAMRYGPVNQLAYDVLKADPLTVEQSPEIADALELAGPFRVNARREPDMRKLSKSDVEALEHGWARCGGADFSRRTDDSHSDPAYKNAEEAGRLRMYWEDFIDESDDRDAKIADLKEVSSMVRI